VLTAKLARLLALFVAELAILVFVKMLQHPLAHLFAIRPTLALGRRRLVGRLLCFVVRLSDAC
jgi:hypothetical protein